MSVFLSYVLLEVVSINVFLLRMSGHLVKGICLLEAHVPYVSCEVRWLLRSVGVCGGSFLYWSPVSLLLP